MKVLAPGKLILSGEHAVVYGHPALAMAVNRYAMATAIPQEKPFISYHLPNLAYERQFSLSALFNLKERIKDKYKRFMHGELTIRHVLQRPVELTQFALSLFFETLNLKLTKGIKIQVQSDIPIGCGMGSSAATILSIIHAIANHLHIEMPAELFYHLGLEAENMQHGYSSGLDLRISIQGGCLYLNDGNIESRTMPHLPFFIVNTGSPKSSTGECVAAVAHYFTQSTIGKQFSAVTTAMDIAIQENKINNLKTSISENHRLLVGIDVVPHTVQTFIASVEQTGGAAKICGAGAVSGETAGVMLVVTEDESALRELCKKYHYTLLPITCESRGVHVV